jgi:hypothetical protein
VCQIISTKDEFAGLASNTNSMLSPVGMAEPPDQLANLRAARARDFAASPVRLLGGALVSTVLLASIVLCLSFADTL